jgi:hypothetical protein
MDKGRVFMLVDVAVKVLSKIPTKNKQGHSLKEGLFLKLVVILLTVGSGHATRLPTSARRWFQC